MCEFELNKTWSKLKITYFCNRTFGPKIFYRNPNPELSFGCDWGAYIQNVKI